jgi:predicted alternative tryptophan synthase beta-subunit
LKATTAQAQIAVTETTTAQVGTSIPIQGLLARAAHAVFMVAAKFARSTIRSNLIAGVDHEVSLQTR